MTRRTAGPPTAFANPHPAETVVRIKVLGPHSTGFGSGTIIYSSPEQSIILTCAISSSSRAGPRQVPPKPVPAPDRHRPVRRQAAQAASGPPKVNYVESFPGRGDRLRLHAGRRADPDPAGPAAPGQPGRAGALAAQERAAADEDAHRRLLGGERRHGLAHADHEPADEGLPPGEARLRGDRVRVRAQAGAIRRRAVHHRRLHRGRLQLRRAAGQSRALCDARGRSTPCSIATTCRRCTPRSRAARARWWPTTAMPSGDACPAARPDGRSRGRSRPTPTSRTAGGPPPRSGDVLLPHYSLLGIKDPVAPTATSPRPVRPPATTRRVAWHPNHAAAPGQDPSAEPAEADRDLRRRRPRQAATTIPRRPPRRAPLAAVNAASQDQSGPSTGRRENGRNHESHEFTRRKPGDIGGGARLQRRGRRAITVRTSLRGNSWSDLVGPFIGIRRLRPAASRRRPSTRGSRRGRGRSGPARGLPRARGAWRGRRPMRPSRARRCSPGR